MTRSKILIVHPSLLDVALEAASEAGLQQDRVFSIQRDPHQRVPTWFDVLVDYSQSPRPLAMTDQESRETIAYLCFSSGTTGT